MADHYCLDYIRLLRARADMVELIHDNLCTEDEKLFSDIDKFTINDLMHIIRDECDTDHQEEILAAIRRVDKLARGITDSKKAKTKQGQLD